MRRIETLALQTLRSDFVINTITSPFGKKLIARLSDMDTLIYERLFPRNQSQARISFKRYECGDNSYQSGDILYSPYKITDSKIDFCHIKTRVKFKKGRCCVKTA